MDLITKECCDQFDELAGDGFVVIDEDLLEDSLVELPFPVVVCPSVACGPVGGLLQCVRKVRLDVLDAYVEDVQLVLCLSYLSGDASACLFPGSPKSDPGMKATFEIPTPFFDKMPMWRSLF